MSGKNSRIHLLGSVAFGIGTGLGAPAAYAVTADAPVASADGSAAVDTQADGSGVGSEIVVLGTSRRDTTRLESTAPVDVITSEQLVATGARTLNQALEKLNPSFNFPQGQNSWNGQNTRSASLKGISPAYTLILVDGKRRNPSSQITNTLPYPASTSVDINTIPFAAIDHVEILHDGAAARYGSDAIAGVVNIVLRKDAKGTYLSGTLGGYTDGGGFTRIINAWQGIKLGSDGFLNISANYTDIGFTNRADPDWRPLFLPGDPRNDTANKSWAKWGNGWSKGWNVLANAGKPLTESISLYGYVNYSHRKSGSYVNGERVVASTIDPQTLQTLTVTPSPRADLALFPDGYDPQSKSDSSDLAVVGGATIGHQETGGKLDLSASYGWNESGKWTLGTTNPSWGANSPTDFYWGSTISRQTTVQADYVRDVHIGVLRSPLVVSAGLVYRHEQWKTGDLADVAAYTNGGLATATNKVPIVAASVDSPIQPQDAGSFSRNVYGGYLGAETDLAKGFKIGLTGRYEHYSDFGSTVNGEATARYEITPAIALRGTFSTGFHAPSLAMLGTQVTSYTTTWSNTGSVLAAPGQTRLFRPNDPLADSFGAKPLDPEKSQTVTGGIVLRPDARSSLTIDAYRLHLKHAVVTTDAINGAVVTQIFNSIGMNGFTQASYYFNGWDSVTKGIDIVGTRHFAQVAGGTLDVSAAISLNRTRLRNVRNTLTLNGTTLSVIDPYRVRDAEHGTPRNKEIFDVNYTRDRLGLDLTVKRYGSYWYDASAAGLLPGGNGNRDQRFGPEVYVDLDVSFQIRRGWRLFVGSQNLFNKYPDKYVIGNRSNGVNTYSFIAPNGASGRFVYGGLDLKL